MQYISIVGCEKPVSTLIKGSDFFLLHNYEDVKEHLDQFIEIGGNTIDTAHIYTDGESEQVIGKYIAENNNREQLVILSKGGIPNIIGQSRLGKTAITEEIMCSLDRLQTSYLDLYALHRDDTQLAVGDILETMNEHVEAGRIRAFGASNWSTARMREANQYAKEHGLVGFSFNSPNLSLALPNEPFWLGCLEADYEMRSWHEETLLPALSWSPAARGFFSGRYKRNVLDDADMVRVFYSDANWERYDRAEQLAKQKSVTVVQIALAFVLKQAYPACAIIGAKNETELYSCNEALHIQLTQEEVRWLDRGD